LHCAVAALSANSSVAVRGLRLRVFRTQVVQSSQVLTDLDVVPQSNASGSDCVRHRDSWTKTPRSPGRRMVSARFSSPTVFLI